MNDSTRVTIGIRFVDLEKPYKHTIAQLMRDDEVRAVLATFDHALTEKEREAFLEDARAVVQRAGRRAGN